MKASTQLDINPTPKIYVTTPVNTLGFLCLLYDDEANFYLYLFIEQFMFFSINKLIRYSWIELSAEKLITVVLC